MSQAASDIYEIVIEKTERSKAFFRSIVVLIVGLFTMGSSPANPGGMIITVVNKETGAELFRHIEDMGDDEGHLLDGIEKDLASMTADEFRATWLG